MKIRKQNQVPTSLWEEWVFYSLPIGKAEPLQFLLPIIHMLGYQDALLRNWEKEFFSRPQSSAEKDMIADNYRMFESYQWVLSAYEVVRTMSQKADQNKGHFNEDETKKIREIKHKLEEVRIPLAKLEPRGRPKKGETSLALPGSSGDSFGWIVEPTGRFYTRRELAESLLELLKFIHENDRKRCGDNIQS